MALRRAVSGALALLISAPASAGALVTAGAAGMEFSMRRPWVGVDVSLLPDRPSGLEPLARISLGWSPGQSGGPFASTELGGAIVLPEDEAILRLGLLTRVTAGTLPHRFPIDLASDEHRHLGIIPSALAMVEFQYGESAPHWVGVKGGVGPSLAAVPCGDDSDEICSVWAPGFVGGFYARKHFASGLAIEATAGTVMSAAVGWRW